MIAHPEAIGMHVIVRGMEACVDDLPPRLQHIRAALTPAISKLTMAVGRLASEVLRREMLRDELNEIAKAAFAVEMVTFNHRVSADPIADGVGRALQAGAVAIQKYAAELIRKWKAQSWRDASTKLLPSRARRTTPGTEVTS